MIRHKQTDANQKPTRNPTAMRFRNVDSGKVLEHAGVRLCKDPDSIRAEGKEIDLSPNEFGVLSYLMGNSSRAVSREELLDHIWGYETAIESRVVDDTVKRLRRKIAVSRLIVETVWGFGFRLRIRI